MRIAICEDIKKEQQQLTAHVAAFLSARKLLAEVLVYESGEALLCAAEQIPFEIFFLDIYMTGISGVTVAEALRKRDKNAAIVFTTSSRDYFAEGFTVGAVHYLVKPYAPEDVSEALERALRQVGETERYIELTINRENRRVLLSDLAWAESRDKVCDLHLQTGEQHSYIQIDDLEHRLDDHRFLRCHHSYLVNLDYVDSMENGCFTMLDGAKIYVRQADATRFRLVYEDYLFEKMRRAR